MLDAKPPAKTQWEVDKCSEHHSYRLIGQAGSKRPIPYNSTKPLADRFYPLTSGQIAVRTELILFGHPDNDTYW